MHARLRPVVKAYDVRGRVPDQLDTTIARALGEAFADEVGIADGRGRAVVGRDMRASSPDVVRAVADGIRSRGADVVDIGLASTDMLYCASGVLDVPGIMVTASHNPGNFNGFKIIVQGQVLSGDVLQLLKPIMIVENFTRGVSEYFSRLVIPQYVRQIFEDIGIVREFKVVVDGSNSVSGPVAVELFESLGCEVVPLYCDIDG